MFHEGLFSIVFLSVDKLSFFIYTAGKEITKNILAVN
jgi:hypothetical protein